MLTPLPCAYANKDASKTDVNHEQKYLQHSNKDARELILAMMMEEEK